CLNNLGSACRQMGDLALSARYYREGLLLAQERPGNREERVVAYLLEGVAALAMEAGDSWRAAWLMAAGNAIPEAMAAPRPPRDQQDFESSVAGVRAEIEASSFDAAWSEGGSARVDTAISTALETVGMSE